MLEKLSQDRIQELYAIFQKQKSYKDWHDSYIEDVNFFRGLTDEELSLPQNQERLWRARGVSSIGPGEAVNTHGAYTDSEIVNTLVSLRNKKWPGEASKRAKEIQGAYDKLLGMVHPKHSPQRPQAKLSRLFTALFPEEFHTGYTWDSYRKISELFLGTKKVPSCESAVLVRERLRSVLGKENDLSKHVQRSIFCWWIYEHYETISSGDKPTEYENASSEEGGSDAPSKLVIWPLTKQTKGISSISSYIDGFRAVVGAARGGATPEDIVQTMQADLGFEGYAAKSCRMVFNRVRRLGFLEHRDGLWYPSEEGERLVEEDPPDVLVEKYLIQFFGLSHLLRLLSIKESMQRKAVFSYFRKLYPGWSTDFMPSALGAWAQSLGLIVDEKGAWQITEYGKTWADRLPDKLEDPPPEVTSAPTSITSPGSGTPKTSSIPWPDINKILEAFEKDDQLSSFVFNHDQIETLHLAWHSQERKRFVILSGLSGTGKTAILFHYARIFCEIMELDVTNHRATIAVSPDWRDPSGLIGYFNALHADPTFQAEPALRLILEAAKNPSKPYFLILDEMNLARVERYFAPFLSAMETGENLILHAHDEIVNGVPPSIHWPINLFVGGTVNMDETTYPFSDKVLDRAFTMEFWKVDIDQYLERRAKKNERSRNQELEIFLKDLNVILKDIRRHFGYRTVGEILDFLDMAGNFDDGNKLRYWSFVDQAVFSKVLPRLRGAETPILRSTLDKIHDLCDGRNLSRCTEKIEQMKQQLSASGVTKFWS
jgi:hypothetical protein